MIQEREWGTFAKGIGWGCERVDVDLVEAPVWERAAECMKVLVASGTCENVIVDISAMPKACFFPALKAALESNVEMVVVIYSEPKEYFSGTLEAEPIGITLLPGFEHLVAERDSPTGWIPILGFSGSFASTVYDALVDTYKFESRIFPMLGFPAFDPSFFERAFRDGCGVLLRSSNSIASQLIYARAFDPFETRKEIVKVMDSGLDVQWIGSPLGPKPMSLGMLLAALDRPLTVVSCAVRSYNPHYSAGLGASRVYVLRQNGRRAFEA